MLDLEVRLWRKPHREQFEEQRRKVLTFAEMWKPYDWTMKLKSSGVQETSDDEAVTSTKAIVSTVSMDGGIACTDIADSPLQS